MATTLDQILHSTRQALPELQARRPALERAASAALAPPAFAAALRRPLVAVIAEVKRRSPSAGVIRAELDPADRATRYVGAGAAAISVLTDGPYFGGSIEDLQAVAAAVPVPVLRKDFILDEAQIAEARVVGAAAVLLIVRALEPARLAALLRYATAIGVESLVEVHTADELAVAVDAGAGVIGVNSRDLDTFRIDTKAAHALLTRVPRHIVAVAESGMAGSADVQAAAMAGADAVLIGTALSSADDPAALAAELARIPRRGR